MTREEPMELLPHRENMLLLHEAALEDGVAHGVYRVSGEEWFLRGHFPGNPVVPGVILCEILAQSACVLLAGGETRGATPYFTSMDKVRFKNPVKPGDTFETTVTLTRVKKPFYFAQGEGKVDGKVCVRAEFSFALVEGK